MRIGVCIKGVVEDNEGSKWVINTFDEYALEEAVRLKEKDEKTEIVVITVGHKGLKEMLYAALATKADRAVHVVTPDEDMSGFGIATILKSVVRQERIDLVLLGKQAVDNASHQIGGMLAGLLNWAQAIDVIELDIEGDEATAHRLAEGGKIEVIRARLPVVIGAAKGLNEPRYPALRGIIAAKKKEIKEIALEELGLAREDLCGIKVERVFAAPEKEACKFIEGEPGKAAEEIVRLLREEAKVI